MSPLERWPGGGVALLGPALLAVACASAEARRAAARSPRDEAAARAVSEDVKALLRHGLPIAADAVREEGEFQPFAAVLRPGGKVEAYGPRRDVGASDPLETHARLTEGLAEAARRGELVAVAVLTDVRMAPPSGGEEVPAVRLEVEHEEGYAADLFIPYTRLEDGVTFGDVIAAPRARTLIATAPAEATTGSPR